jgi:exopolysaccharide production protein ExoQ
MDSSIALFVFVIGIIALFFLDRDNSVRPSKALWLPVIFMWINGSRPISVWLGLSPLTESPTGPAAGNLLDQLVALILMVFAIIVLGHRARDVIFLLRRSWPIVLYFSFCLVSVLWSDFPGHGLMRWIKALGELVMAMILATEAQPDAALGRFFSRVGFVLLPTSVLLITYYPSLGRSYEPGLQMNTGVTTNKNGLGVLTFVLALGALWQVLRILRDRRPNRARHLLAQGGLLSVCIALLFMAHSATSGACFALGAGLMLVIALPLIRRSPVAVHVLVLTLVLCGCLTVLLGGHGEAVKAMGRHSDLTGRTEIWEVLIPMGPNPIVGAGFETFWYGPRIQIVDLQFPNINEAHNGYLEVYLNLGLFGVGLIVLILAHGYRSAVAAFRRDSVFGSLLTAYILTAAIYSITEAGFRMLNPIWFFLLLSVVTASRVIGSDKRSAAPEVAYHEEPRYQDSQRNYARGAI